MEPKILFLLLASHSVLSAKYLALEQINSAYISDISTIAPKMMLQRNYSEKVFNAEFAKLQNKMQLYKQKIQSHQNARKHYEGDIHRRLPPNCKKIKCPLEEKPVCAKFFFKNRKSPPFYVSMINECEMNYMKCHRGLESTIVSMENCHSVLDYEELSAHSEKKRSKRSAKAAPPAKRTYKVKPSPSNKSGTKLNKPHPNPPNGKTVNLGKKINLKTKSNVKTTISSQKTTNEPIKTKLKAPLNDDPETSEEILTTTLTTGKNKANNKKIDLKSEKANHKPLNNKKLPLSNKTNVTAHETKLPSLDKTKLKLVSKSAPSTNVNNKNLKIDANQKAKSADKINLKSEVPLKPTKETNVKLKSKPIKIIINNSERASQIKKTKPVSKTILKSKPNVSHKNNTPKRVNVAKKSNKKPWVRKPVLREGLTGVGNGHYILNDIQTLEREFSDEHNADGANVIDDDSKQELADTQNEKTIEHSKQVLLTATNEPPLVEEPIVDEHEPFHEEDDYRYRPDVAGPEIVSLDVEKVKDVDKRIEPTDNYQASTIPPDPPRVTDNSVNMEGDGSKASTKNNGNGTVNNDQYVAECPTQCPARDLMVCAVCQHGIYRTFLSICHMRMFQCRMNDEQLELVSRYPCVVSAPLITENPSMQPEGRLTEPGDTDLVLRYVRCRQKQLLGKSPKCTFEESQVLRQQNIEFEVDPSVY